MKIYIIPIIFIILTTFTYAYTLSDISSYWTMGDGASSTTLFDAKDSINLVNASSSWNNKASALCIQGACLYGTSQSSEPRFTNEFLNAYNTNDFTFNQWALDTNGGNYPTNYYYMFKIVANTNIAFVLAENSTHYINMTVLSNSGSSGTRFCVPPNASTILTNQWHMITTEYNMTSTKISVYIDSVSWCNITNTSSFISFTLGNQGMEIRFEQYEYIDEMSVFTKSLSQSEINTLYNSGLGLTYQMTLSSATDYVNPFNNTNSSLVITYNSSWNNFTINDSIFSTKQCVNIGNGLDYVCNDTFYNPTDNGFYCRDVLNLTSCGAEKVCMTYVYDLNTSDFYMYNYLKSCNYIRQQYPTLNLYCTAFVATSPLTAILNAYFGYSCNFLNLYPMPTSYCVDNPPLTYWQSHYNDTLYIEGQCTGTGCTNSCNPNEYSCNNTRQQQKCVLFPDGCYHNNITLTCSGTDQCSSGSCIPTEAPTPPPTPPATSGSQNIAGIDLSGWDANTKFWTVIITMVLTVSILIGIGIYAGEMMIGIMGLLAGCMLVAELFFFAFIGFIATWIIVLIIIVGAAIGALIIRNIFTQGSG